MSEQDKSTKTDRPCDKLTEKIRVAKRDRPVKVGLFLDIKQNKQNETSEHTQPSKKLEEMVRSTPRLVTPVTDEIKP